MRHEPCNGYLFVELVDTTGDGEFKIADTKSGAMREAKIMAPGDTPFAPGEIVLLRPDSWESVTSGPWSGHIIHRDAILAKVKS